MTVYIHSLVKVMVKQELSMQTLVRCKSILVQFRVAKSPSPLWLNTLESLVHFGETYSDVTRTINASIISGDHTKSKPNNPMKLQNRLSNHYKY